MQVKTSRTSLQAILILGAVTVSLVISPSTSFEPIDLPKLATLVVTGFSAFGMLLSYPFLYFKMMDRFTRIAISLFVLDLIFVILFSGAPFNQQFFGTFGRNTGFLAYLSLIFVFIGSYIATDRKYLGRLISVLFATGLLTVIYGTFQTFKHDPIHWNNNYNAIIGFLGNPDFASSFIGFSSAATLAFVFRPSTKIHLRMLSALFSVWALLVIVRSHAQQGAIVFAAVFFIITYTFLRHVKQFHKFVRYTYSLLALILSVFVTLGIFRVGPLSSLYKISVRQRGFYWHAAIQMMASNPVNGVGLDSYGDQYLKFRSANAAFFSQPTQSNAAHNVFLDMGATGGYPLFLIYLALFIFILFIGIKQISNAKDFDWKFISIFSAWVGYQIQSVVSINQLGLAIWGWALGGAIVGYHFLDSNQGKELTSRSRAGKRQVRVNSSPILTTTLIGFVMGALLALPPFLADHRYRQVLASRDANKLIAETYTYPKDMGRILNTAQALASSKLYPQALDVLKHAIKEDENSYNAWALIYQITPKGSDLSVQALQKMKIQNPKDSTLK